jgi:hypothetical protein
MRPVVPFGAGRCAMCWALARVGAAYRCGCGVSVWVWTARGAHWS